VAVYGDSNCLDDSHRTGTACFWLVEELLGLSPLFSGAGQRFEQLGDAWVESATPPPLPEREMSQLGNYRLASRLWRQSSAVGLVAPPPPPDDVKRLSL
jgi:hypothetical protein